MHTVVGCRAAEVACLCDFRMGAGQLLWQVSVYMGYTGHTHTHTKALCAGRLLLDETSFTYAGVNINA